jgi:hypothetical protein
LKPIPNSAACPAIGVEHYEQLGKKTPTTVCRFYRTPAKAETHTIHYTNLGYGFKFIGNQQTSK